MSDSHNILCGDSPNIDYVSRRTTEESWPLPTTMTTRTRPVQPNAVESYTTVCLCPLAGVLLIYYFIYHIHHVEYS